MIEQKKSKVVPVLLALILVAVVVAVVVGIQVNANAAQQVREAACDAQYQSGSFEWFYCMGKAK